MPTNISWTAAEDAYLCSGASNVEFEQRFPQRRTDEGLRRRRYHLKLPNHTQAALNKLRTAEEVDEDQDWEERWSHLEKADAVLERIAPTPESTTWIAPDRRPVGIVFLGDIHAGASGVRYDLLRRDLALIAETDGLYVIGMGDVIENVKPQSKAGPALYHALFPNPREQLLYVQERMRICTGKWIAICQGNHDAWDAKWAGIDRLPDLASSLGATYFTEGGGTVFVESGGQRYVLIVRHNHAGNSRINTTNAQRRMFDEFLQWENADVVCIAHFHFNDLQHVTRKGQPVVYLRCGTYKVRDPYAQIGAFQPEYGLPMIICYPDEKKIIPFRGDQWLDGVRFLASERARYA